MLTVSFTTDRYVYILLLEHELQNGRSFSKTSRRDVRIVKNADLYLRSTLEWLFRVTND